MNATADTTTLTVDGLRVRLLHVRPAGIENPAKVLVLHGWGASVDAVGSIVAGLRDTVELVAFDLPGMGESQMVPAAWGNRDYAAFTIRLADAVGFDRFALVGHSRGAAVSLVLASDPATSGRVERMVLTGAAGIKPRRPASYYMKVGSAKAGRVIGAVGGKPGKSLQQKIRGKAASADWLAAPEELRGTLRNVLADDLSPLLPQVDAPTLLIWGPDDDSTPLWMGEQMEREIPGAALIVLRSGGHFAYAERAGEFNVIASHFLTQGGRR
ncbi:alpha/beta hydrolase [Conexibacter sp. JD483]|uniref:alpha/beta fold hydrolase n=1 Tax=unclassified Conexibacter TaxID=2627773 RepID=UPI00271E0AD6|nr:MULTISPECIES: alpha/beta hydrolase [unclassified Conexibacter]MDO8187910.1 alpha/beta hydrolase [Conexibacter sp. CPCC 205706]MDO8198639.1 alpha/beta hydrolase [Conexibacter sp. CPCC 205762]MDR9369679.1 alpha/beta hydrolase [Conexibacter sp. JD483]